MDELLKGDFVEQALKILGIAIPVILGGYFTLKQANKKAEIDKIANSSDSQDKFRDDLLRRVSKLEDDNLSFLKQIQELYQELSKVRSEYALMEVERDGLLRIVENYDRKVFEIPFPSWVKREDGLMIKINDAYEDLILKPHGLSRADYEKKFDKEIHGEELAAEYHIPDMFVYTKRRPWVGVERYRRADGSLAEAPCAKWEVTTVDGLRAIQGVILVLTADVFRDGMPSIS